MLLRRVLVVLLAACTSRPAAPSPDAAPLHQPRVERWAGTLMLPTDLRDIGLTFRLATDGTWSGKMDVPALGLTGLDLTEVSVEPTRIAFVLPKPKLPRGAWEVYAFAREPDAAEAEGTLAVGAHELPARLVRLAEGEVAAGALRRPQTPRPPFPYTVREVSVPGFEGAVLAGTLTLPAGAGPHPALLLLSGSGQQDRDETIFGHRPFAVLADRLAREGVAALRLDDRGVGKTQGPVGSLDTEIEDALLALAFLAAQPEIDPRRTGVLGHSTGGVVAPSVVARGGKAGFIVSLAGPVVTGAELIPMQTQNLLLAGGAPAEIVTRMGEIQRAVTAVARGGDDAATRAAVAAAIVDSAKAAGQQPPAAGKELEAIIDQKTRELTNPWTKSFLTLDPRAAWAKVKVPTLALFGDKDLQVPAEVNILELEKAAARAGNRAVVAKKLPGLNHLYPHADKGTVDEYGRLEETFDPATLELIVAFVKGQVGVKGAP